MSNNVSIEYANAKIKTFEKYLLTRDKIVRLIDSETTAEAIKILMENDYGDGIIDDNGDFDGILSKEESKVYSLFGQLMPSGYGLEIFLYKNDYHNAKVCYKCKIVGEKSSTALKPNGLFDVKKSFDQGKYDVLPAPMVKAIKSLDELSSKSALKGYEVDNAFDKAYYENVFADLKKAKKSVVYDYVVQTIDSLNIKNFARCKRIGVDFDYYSDCFVVGGKLDIERVKTLYPLTLEECKEKTKYTDFKKDFEAIADKNVEYETFVDNRLIELIKNQKSDMFSPSPILGYYLGKLTEIKVVRTLLTCKQNRIAESEIRKRIRETYA